MFDMHWLKWTSRKPLLRLTSLNVLMLVIKRHSNVITIWRTSAIEVTALIKTLRSEMKGVQNKYLNK